MKNNLQDVSKMIVKKSNTYLKVSLFIFELILIAFSTVFLVSMKERIHDEKNFDNNIRVHTIAIHSKMLKDYTVNVLTASDVEEIKKILERSGFQERDYRLSPVYGITTGIIDYDSSEPYVIYGIPSDSYWLNDNQQMQDEVLYMKHSGIGNINLLVSLLNEEEGGMSTNEAKNYSMKTDQLKSSALTLYDDKHQGLRYAYVNGSTFCELFSTVNQITVTEEEISSNMMSDYNVIDKLFLYIDDLYKVEDTARLLEDSSYQVSCTLDAFDSFGHSMKEKRVFMAILMVIMVILTIVIVVLSFQAYLKIQQKDMGILKFYGYNEKKLQEIYSRSINRMFLKLCGFVMIYTILFGFVCVTFSSILYVLLDLLIVGIVLLCTNRIVVLHLLKKMLRKNILELVKISKEFE